jgi:hypothetical protein
MTKGALCGQQVDTNTVNTATHSINRPRYFFAALLLALLAAAFLAPAAPAMAQEEEGALDSVVLFDGTAGAYHIKVTQLPAAPVVGIVRVVVEPTNAATGAAVEHALVRVFATPNEEGERQYSPALNSPTDRSLYFAQFDLDKPGVWAVDVEVDSDLGREIAITQMEIRPRSRSGDNTLIGTAIFALIGVGFIGSGLWLWHSSKKARARRDEMQRSGHGPTTVG